MGLGTGVIHVRTTEYVAVLWYLPSLVLNEDQLGRLVGFCVLQCKLCSYTGFFTCSIIMVILVKAGPFVML